ncbi:MAG: phytanoyl-CoA dioxygenase family protein [Alphaproteobacteria bacterium]|jgi:ectoine hydroxylase|nr:phytanoyl-CoA dioxygenase family protein [Alphaproteobacteria bacterium]
MKPEDILSHPPKVLSQEQREAYFETGYLVLEDFIDDDWLDRLWTVTNRFIDDSRSHTKSGKVFDLEPNHTAEEPRLRRISQPVALDPVYEEFGLRGPIVDLAEDLVGPNVKYHHSKLNMKWSGGGEEVKWHQDIQFWPHTNYSPLTIGLYMDDVDDEMGPMGVIPGSHKGEIYDLYGDDGNWVGALSDDDLAGVERDKAIWMRGGKGSITIHNCRMLHGSMANNSPRSRRLLLHTYASADALTFPNSVVTGVPFADTLIRGEPAKWIHFDPEPCLIPPDWSKGYSSIFALQQEEAAGK